MEETKFFISNKFIVDNDLTTKDVNIIYYIDRMLKNEKMSKYFENDKKFVWLKSEKILFDNPSLKIKRRALETIIKKLLEKKIIIKVVHCDERIKKCYYSLNYNFILNENNNEIYFFNNINEENLKIIQNYFLDYYSHLKKFTFEYLLKPDEKIEEKIIEDNFDNIQLLFENDVKKYISKIGYNQYLKTPLWKYNRKKAEKVKNNRCVICKKRSNLHTHHLTYENVGFEKEEDLCYLCELCHYEVHKGQISREELLRSINNG